MNDTNRLTAVAYLRIARSDTDSADSLQRQQQRCDELAASVDAQIIASYTDDGVSGRSAERPALSELLRHVERDRIDIVIAADSARLACDRRLSTELSFQIEMSGATLLTNWPGADEYDA